MPEIGVDAACFLQAAGYSIERNAWGAVSLWADGKALDYRSLPWGPVKRAWNDLSVCETD